uniref:DUF3850 domain-containing protein n=1 Tax=Strongyloides venezuelensis TaxID=75913 RepID=A0A0K0FRI0_STRVS
MRKCFDNFDLWNEVVWLTMYSYYRLIHGTTLHTPYEIMFGQKLILKSDKREEVEKIAGFKDNEIIRSHNYLLVEQLIEALREKRYDKDNFEVTHCSNDDKLNVGDRVIIREYNSDKWEAIYSRDNEDVYIVNLHLKNAGYVVKKKRSF